MEKRHSRSRIRSFHGEEKSGINDVTEIHKRQGRLYDMGKLQIENTKNKRREEIEETLGTAVNSRIRMIVKTIVLNNCNTNNIEKD